MLWLIDGYNVIRRDPGLAGIERESLEDGRNALLRLIARVARDSPDDFVVVFDGARVSGVSPSGGRVRVLFSRPPDKAGHVLMRLARLNGAGATVVTSDRAIQGASRRARAAVVSADAFLNRVTAPSSDERDRAAEEDDRRGPRKGNPRRLSRAERQSRRSLGRLRRPEYPR